jgi:subfamily B ATP-binding cassette protein HlyB/CyaB
LHCPDRIFSSLSNILEENLELQENQIILKRYFDFDTSNANKQTAHNKIKNFMLDSIEFKDVYFEYTPQKPVLKNLHFSIKANAKIKIEGSNGAGKSTFCKVLSMLYPPSSGEIFINNQHIPFFNESTLRKKILLISNDDLLFNDTLGFNITFSNEYNTAQLLELSKQIGFYDFTSNNENAFDFIITEQGRNLSTGQRKKILLMRALVSEAELIIIDEVLSGIDKESKEKIEDLINREKERAFIIISHEPVDSIRFDKILKFYDGNLK